MKTFIMVILALFIAGCARLAPIAGGSSDSGNPCVLAEVRHADGSPAAGAVVRLRRSDYVTPPAGLAKSAIYGANALTDAQGRFELDGIDPGAYCIEVNDGRSAVLFTCSLGVHDTVDFGAGTLLPFATVSVAVDSLPGAACVQVYGLERLAGVDSARRCVLADLPEGALDFRIITPGAVTRPIEIAHIKTLAGQAVMVAAEARWPWSRWLYINTKAAGVAEDAVRFPLLVRLDSTNFNFAQTDGSVSSIKFLKEDLTPLPYEIESWNSGAKSAAIWVALDTVHGNSTAQFITMSWSDVPQGQPADASIFDTANGFSGVWHLDESGSGVSGEYKDATLFGNNGTGGNGVAAQTPSRIGGVIGGAQSFDGINDFIQVPDHQSLELVDQMTASFWFYYDSAQSYNARIISKDMDWNIKIASGRPQITAGRAYYLADAVFRKHAWNHVAVTVSGLSGIATPTVYLNGQPCSMFENTFPDSFNTADRTHVGDLFFGQIGDNSFYLQGAMDEIWLQRTARPAAWIALLYENQRKGGALVK